MINISFTRAGDPSCPTERCSVEPTMDKIIESARLYLYRHQRWTSIEQIAVRTFIKMYRLCDVPKVLLRHMNNCTLILSTTSGITLHFTSGNDRYSGASTYVLDPTPAAIKTAARHYLAKKKNESVVKSIKLKEPFGPACNLDNIPPAEIPKYNNFTVVVYSE